MSSAPIYNIDTLLRDVPVCTCSDVTYEEPDEHLISGHHCLCTERPPLSSPHWMRDRRRRLSGCLWLGRSSQSTTQYKGQTNGSLVWCHGLNTVTICFQVVVKLFHSNEHQRSTTEQRVRREVAAWRFLEHPNVAKFLGIAYFKQGLPPGVVSPYMQRNDILVYLGRHPDLKHKKVRPSNLWHRKGNTLIQTNNRPGLRDRIWAAISA